MSEKPSEARAIELKMQQGELQKQLSTLNKAVAETQKKQANITLEQESRNIYSSLSTYEERFSNSITDSLKKATFEVTEMVGYPDTINVGFSTSVINRLVNKLSKPDHPLQSMLRKLRALKSSGSKETYYKNLLAADKMFQFKETKNLLSSGITFLLRSGQINSEEYGAMNLVSSISEHAEALTTAKNYFELSK